MRSAKIALLRHGNRDGDNLTVKGEAQIETMSKILLALELDPDLFLHSPSNRTKQSALIAKNIFKSEAPCKEHYDLSPGPIIQKVFPAEEYFEKEVELIVGKGGTVSDAINLGVYPKVAHEKLKEFLFWLAESLFVNERSTALCFSHMCYSTLGHSSKLVPYCAPEASCVIYRVDQKAGYKTLDLDRFITLPE